MSQRKPIRMPLPSDYSETSETGASPERIRELWPLIRKHTETFCERWAASLTDPEARATLRQLYHWFNPRHPPCIRPESPPERTRP